MNIPSAKQERLESLARVVRREIHHLRQTDERLFHTPFSAHTAAQLEANIDLAERVEAFVGRFGRLQDTLDGKLLPRYLDAVGEAVGPAVDNLDRAEKLGVIESAETWFTLRGLRNRMVPEYMDDPANLADALNQGHRHVGMLTGDAERILADLQARGWIRP